MDKRLFTEIETAAYLGMSRSFLRRSRMEGNRDSLNTCPTLYPDWSLNSVFKRGFGFVAGCVTEIPATESGDHRLVRPTECRLQQDKRRKHHSLNTTTLYITNKKPRLSAKPPGLEKH